MILNFMGPPGAGKGTQAKLVEEQLGLVQISTGNMLRQAVTAKTKMGVEADKFMQAGGLVPDGVVTEIMEERIQQPDCKDGFILDGFPRTTAQAEALDQIFDKHNIKLDHVIYFDVPDQELIDRLLGRAQKEGRTDDNLETIKNRLNVFKEKTQPILDYYKSKGNFVSIEGTGSIDDIAGRVKEIIGK